LLEKNQPGGKVLGIDMDQDALSNAPKRDDLILAHSNFRPARQSLRSIKIFMTSPALSLTSAYPAISWTSLAGELLSKKKSRWICALTSLESKK
jgi:hypothetical protein